MSRYIAIDDEPAEEFCTNRGWSEVVKWAETLNLSSYPNLAHLAEYGYCSIPYDLCDEIKKAIRTNPPAVPQVLSTLRNLRKLAKSAAETATIMITDGMIPDEQDSPQGPKV